MVKNVGEGAVIHNHEPKPHNKQKINDILQDSPNRNNTKEHSNIQYIHS
jgi:hypothetical protein